MIRRAASLQLTPHVCADSLLPSAIRWSASLGSEAAPLSVRRAGLARAAAVALVALTVSSLSGAVLVLRYAAVSLGGDGSADSVAAASATFRPVPLLNLFVAATLATSAVLLLTSGAWGALTRAARMEAGVSLTLALSLWLAGIATSHGSHAMIVLVAAGWSLLGVATWRLRAALAR